MADRVDALSFDNIGAVIANTTNEPTGFPNVTDSTLSWNDGTRTLTISPVSSSFDYSIKGNVYTASSARSKQITNTEGIWFFYLDNTGTLQATQTWSTVIILEQNAYVAAIYWNATDNVAIYFGDERHGLTMDWATHSYLHNCNGLRYQDGFSISGYTIDTDSDAAVSIGISNGIVWDEDLRWQVNHAAVPANPFEQVLTDPAQIPVYYKAGAGNYWKKDAATNFPFKNTASGQVNFNEYTGGAWQQTQATDGNFVAYWVFASNDRNEPIKVIQGERQDTSLVNAAANNTFASLQLGGLPTQEIKILYRLIVQTSSAFAGTRKAKISQVDDYRNINNLGVVAGSGGGGGITDHPLLTSLGFAVSGHTGFQRGLPVTDFVVSGGAVTNITISGLDINTDGGYEVIAELLLDNAGADTRILAQINGDNTGANYESVFLNAGSGGTYVSYPEGVHSRILTPGPNIAAGIYKARLLITKDPNGKGQILSHYDSDSAGGLIMGISEMRHLTVDANITSFTLEYVLTSGLTPIANKILNGSRIRVSKIY